MEHESLPFSPSLEERIRGEESDFYLTSDLGLPGAPPAREDFRSSPAAAGRRRRRVTRGRDSLSVAAPSLPIYAFSFSPIRDIRVIRGKLMGKSDS